MAAIVAMSVLALPVAQAEPAEADVLDVRGPQVHTGQALALSLHGADGGIEGMRVAASAGYLVRWEQAGAYVQCLAGPCDEVSQSLPLEQEPDRHPSDERIIDLHGELLAAEPGHQINVVSLDDPGIGMRIENGHSRWSGLEDACLTQAGVVPDHANRPLCDGYRESEGTYSNVWLGRAQMYRSEDGHVSLRGNMSLEMRGIALETDAGTLDTRDERDPGPGGRYARVFGRLVLINATVDITLAPGSDVQWAMQQGRAEGRGAVLTGRAGLVQFGDRSIDFSAGQALQGDFVVVSSTGPNGMPFTVVPPEPALASTAPATASGWGLAALAVAGIVPVAVVLAARRHAPTMASVEQALRTGRFRRAVRLSDRILRREPLHESAQLSRAIGLTKSGRFAAAVDGVRRFLARAEPGDGTLHFVMGMALLELGRPDEARQAMGRAIERTPALLADVAPELRPSGAEAAYT